MINKVKHYRFKTYFKLSQALRLGQKVGQISQTDARELEVLEIDERDVVAIQKGHILLVNVEDVVGWLLDAQALQIWTRINQSGKVEVVSRNQLQRLDRFPHVRDVGRMLCQGDVELACDAVDQLDVLGVGEDVTEAGHHLVYSHMDTTVVFNGDYVDGGQSQLV